MRVSRRTLMAGAGSVVATPALGWTTPAAAARTEEPLLHGMMPSDALPERLEPVEPGLIRIDRGWRFHEGDIVPPRLRKHDETYLAAKAGGARGAAAIAFDDSGWVSVDVPHDWAIRQPFDRDANTDQGYKPRGIGWYRKTIILDEADRGRKIALRFGGIATHATIWVNGSIAARNWSGYTAIEVDLTPYARFGGDQPNIIAVRVDAQEMEGWWYEGAGIYRHVTLAKRPAVSIATDGFHCDPRHDGDDRWRVPVTVTLENVGEAAHPAELSVVLRDDAGREVSRGTASGTVDPLGRRDLSCELALSGPRRWSPETPTLYRVEIVATSEAGTDRRQVPIGFRTIRFDANRGFFLNDQPVKLKGVCLHQDHAGVGTAVPDALLEWRLRRMKDVGVNAIRCSHNSQADAFYALCDRMGFLVMDENRIFNPAPDHLAEMEWLVRAHRNHPSIILWSVFNEEPMQGSRAGREMVRRMVAAVKALDDSRPVTAAMNGGLYEPENVSQAIEVMGFNYQTDQYDKFHALNPKLPSSSSEDTSAFMTRGAYRTDRAAHVMSSMDTEAADWGATHRKSWAMIAERPYLAGGFVWTGFDYHGEPTPFEWPTVSSFFGILDLCGFAKTAYDIRRAQWIDDHPVIGIAPHWTWPGREGEQMDVLVTSNAERVRLLLNGKPVGEQAGDRIHGALFKTVWQPGEIVAIGLKGGREVVRTRHRTAGPPAALQLLPARTLMRADGEDVVPVTIHAVDRSGRHVPIAQHQVMLTIEGGEIIGLGNGDPNSHEPAQGDRRSLFNGLAQALVRARSGAQRLRIVARADGLKDGSTSIRLV